MHGARSSSSFTAANFTGGNEDQSRAVGSETASSDDALRIHHRLGRQLAQARLEQKFTQRQVAKLAHIDQGQVSEVERGVGNPTLRILSAMAEAVGLEVDLRPALPRVDPAAAADRKRKAANTGKGLTS
jgi:XRE family transcriptional regulator, regulator of sulfur utilization